MNRCATNEQVEAARSAIEQSDDEELEQLASLAAKGEWAAACDVLGDAAHVAGFIREVLRLRAHLSRWNNASASERLGGVK